MHALPGTDCCALQDLHEPQVLAALTRLCTASLQLQPIQGLLQEVAGLSQGKQGGPHGQLQLRLKRHTGRVRVEAELYSLHQDGSMRTSAVPQEAVTAQLLAAHAMQHAGQFVALLSHSARCILDMWQTSQHIYCTVKFWRRCFCSQHKASPRAWRRRAQGRLYL